jgi:hypothetical protein
MQNSANVITTEIRSTRGMKRMTAATRGKFFSAYSSACYEIYENLSNLDDLRPWNSMGYIAATWNSAPSTKDEMYIVDVFNKHFRHAEVNTKLYWHADRKGYFPQFTDSLK